MENDTLKDKLSAWAQEYPSLKDHGWTGNKLSDMVDSLWEFLQDNIGPTQQKLWDGLQIARERAALAERDARRVGDQLAILIRDSASDS